MTAGRREPWEATRRRVLDSLLRTGQEPVTAGALARGLGVAVAVSFGEQRVFHAATPGSGAVNDAWLDRKFRVVRHFGHATLTVRTQYEAGGSTFDEAAALDPRRYQAAGGGFPLVVRGNLVGAVGVSGLEMHDDHALVVEALRAHLAHVGQRATASS